MRRVGEAAPNRDRHPTSSPERRITHHAVDADTEWWATAHKNLVVPDENDQRLPTPRACKLALRDCEIVVSFYLRLVACSSRPYFHQYSTCTPKLEPLRALPKAPVSDSAEPSANRFAASCAALFQVA